MCPVNHIEVNPHIRVVSRFPIRLKGRLIIMVKMLNLWLYKTPGARKRLAAL